MPIMIDDAMNDLQEIAKSYGTTEKAEDGDSVQAQVTTGKTKKGEDTPGRDQESSFKKPTSKASRLAEEALEKAVWSTSYVNDLPDSAFLHIESGGKKDSEGKTEPRSLRHFPVKDKNGKIDPVHVRNAIAQAPKSKLPDEVKSKVQEKGRRMLADLEKSIEKAIIQKDADYGEHLQAIYSCHLLLDAAAGFICEHGEITPQAEGIVSQVLAILGAMTVEHENKEREMEKRFSTLKRTGRTIRRNITSLSNDWPTDLNSAEFLGDDIRDRKDRPAFGKDLTKPTNY